MWRYQLVVNSEVDWQTAVVATRAAGPSENVTSPEPVRICSRSRPTERSPSPYMTGMATTASHVLTVRSMPLADMSIGVKMRQVDKPLYCHVVLQ